MGIDIIDRVLRSQVVRAGIRRAIVDRAARMLDPQRQSFSTARQDVRSMFESTPGRGPLALYIHFPFCASACKYCVFKKTIETGLIERYVGAVLDEIDLCARQPALAGRRLGSIHLGGGTPSLVAAAEIDRVLSRLRERFGFTERIQVTLEGNPESLTASRARGYRAAGVDRISIGIQSLDDDLLRAMGRTHGRDEALRAIRDLRAAGFDNLSADLMYGFDGQSTARFLDDIRTLVDLGLPHVSAFPLIEKSARATGSAERRRRDARHREMYGALADALEGAGYTQYSSDDFALRPEAESKYQIHAWRFPKGDVLALGAGSLGALGGCFYSNIPELDRYFDAIAQARPPVARVARVSRREEIRRGVLLGAKYLHVSRAAFAERYGVEIETALEPLLTRFCRLGIWTLDDRGIHVTRDGSQLISAIWSELILAQLADAASGGNTPSVAVKVSL